jgi:hypothetical protein
MMPLSRNAELPHDNYQPWSPDGTRWIGDWPPEVWLVKWRLHGLGYRKIRQGQLAEVTAQSQRLYVEAYGHAPTGRVLRRVPATVVFEHARVWVIDEAARAVLGIPLAASLV